MQNKNIFYKNISASFFLSLTSFFILYLAYIFINTYILFFANRIPFIYHFLLFFIAVCGIIILFISGTMDSIVDRIKKATVEERKNILVTLFFIYLLVIVFFNIILDLLSTLQTQFSVISIFVLGFFIYILNNDKLKFIEKEAQQENVKEKRWEMEISEKDLLVNTVGASGGTGAGVTDLFRECRFLHEVDFKKVVSYVFLGLLLLITVHSILPETPGRMVLDVVRIPIVVATIVLGVVTFYLNRDVLGYIEEESRQEGIAERKREAEFTQRYSKVNRVWGVRWVARWMYKEGGWYSGGMISIVLFGLFLRLFYLDYLDGSDNYTIIAVKNLYENGVTFYRPDGYITPNLMLFFSKIFGYNSFALRLPSILYSLITMVCIYFISKNFNKKIAIISLIFFSISPWSIVVSRITRDYPFDCMIGCIILLISIKLYQKIIEEKSKKEIIYLLFLPVLIRFLSEFNHRSQTQLVIIIPFITLLCVVWYYLLSNKSTQQSNSILSYIKNYKMYKRWGIFFFFLIIIIIAMYLVDYKIFNFGFHYDRFYFDAFFNPSTESPWQWFHNNYLNIYFIIALFFFPLLTSLFLKNKKMKFTLLLYFIFFFGLGIFTFKFVSHINYNPTRYIYFLFPIYAIIFSIGLYYFINLFKKSKMEIPIFILFIFLFFNFNSIYYAIYPIAAYNNENIYNLKIDNIGLGRFNMYPLVDFIKNDLNSSENETFVFGGRYGEFILLLNYSMDPERYLSRSNYSHYDVGKNMFVESSYFNYHELKEATLSSKNGYLVTCDSNITDYENNPIQKLNDQSFVLYETDFQFINKINIFKIYYWNQSHSR